MFIKTLADTFSDEKLTLAFVKSLNVQAFPCGRRRSIEHDNSGNRIPFDPEARLNTEANNVKHSGLNGFTQTYLNSWDEDGRNFTASLAGYFFKVDLDAEYLTPNGFGSMFVADLAKLLNTTAENLDKTVENIYLNILIENTPLFRGEPRGYDTSVLSSLAASIEETALDLFARDDIQANSDADDYYFSGLSFSSRPLAPALRKKYATDIGFDTRDDFSFSASDDDQSRINKRVISLHLLKKIDGEWKIHNPARLPQVTHGELENSVKIENLYIDTLHSDDADITEATIGNISAETISANTKITAAEVDVDVFTARNANVDTVTANNVSANSFTQNGNPVPTICVVQTGEEFQLQIFGNATANLPNTPPSSDGFVIYDGGNILGLSVDT